MMKRKRFARSGMNRLREIPREKFGNPYAGNTRRSKGGQMQRLAHMARRVAPAIFMLMEERAAGCKIQ